MVEILVVEVAGVRYGLHAAAVRELLRAVAIVPLPSAPPAIEGVVDVRGRIVPVLDIRRRFRLPARAVVASDQLVYANAGALPVLVRVDRVVDFQAIDERAIEDARAAIPHAEYLAGIAKLPDGLVLLHDLASFLSADEAGALVDLELESDATAEPILVERARQLARPLVVDTAPTEELEILVAISGANTYAIETRFVHRVMPTAISPVPGAPAILLGIASLHGEVLPVFDPLVLFGARASDHDDALADIVVLGRDRPELGFAVTRADRIERIAASTLVPPAVLGGDNGLLRGVLAGGLAVLDGDRVLADRRMILDTREN